jgi:hypothetical protein
LENDGCTTGCELSCERLLDTQTGTGYFIGSSDVEPVNMAGRCEEFGAGAYPLSIRSHRERDLVIAWLEGSSLSLVLAGLYQDGSSRLPPAVGNRRVAVMDRAHGWRWRVGSTLNRFGLVCERSRPGHPDDNQGSRARKP